MALTFVRHERSHVADDWRAVRQPECFVHVHWGGRLHVPQIDAFVHGRRPLRRHAVRHEHLSDRLGRRDEAVHLPVLPPRERVAFQMKIDATRRDERRRRRAARRSRAKRQRERGHRHPVRVVRVNDVRPQPLDHPRQPPCGRQIHFRARRERDQLEPLASAAPQLAARMRDERRPLADRAQTVHRDQNLVLSAAPGAGRIDVQGKHASATLYHEATEHTKNAELTFPKSSSCPSCSSCLRDEPVTIGAPTASRISGRRNTNSARR